MEHILQRNLSDCGVASLAMLYGTTYPAMKRVMDKLKIDVVKKGTSAADFRAVGEAMGDPVVQWVIGPKTYQRVLKRLQSGIPALLIVQPSEDGNPYTEFTHAIGWSGTQILDPAASPQYRYYPKTTDISTVLLYRVYVRQSVLKQHRLNKAI